MDDRGRLLNGAIFVLPVLTTILFVVEGDELSEGNCNEGGWNLVGTDGSSEVKKDASFAWRGGQERQTTGIWMWSEPFIRRSQSYGK